MTRMTYIQKSNNNRFSAKRKILLFIIIVLVVGLLSTTSFVQILSNKISLPFFRQGDDFNNTYQFTKLLFGDKAALADKILRLENQVNELKILETDLFALKFESERLRSELGSKPTQNFLYGSVVGRSPQLPQDSLLLDIGEYAGVRMGDLVFASDRSLIGSISKTSKISSIVLLNSSSSIKLNGFVSRTGEIIEITGSGGNSMQTQVPLNFDIMIGDVVMYSHISDNAIAVVGVVEENKAGGFKKVFLSLPTNTNKLKSVFVRPSLISEIDQ